MYNSINTRLSWMEWDVLIVSLYYHIQQLSIQSKEDIDSIIAKFWYSMC